MIDYIQTAQALLDDMQTHMPQWEWLRRHIMPDPPETEGTSKGKKTGHSTVACDALHILAGAHLMYMTPAGQQWFSLKPAHGGQAEPGEQDWLAAATQITHAELANSNFYTAVHQCFIDRCLTGTGCVFCSTDSAGKLVFKHIPTGTYALAEGPEDTVDTLARLIDLTPHCALQQFGAERLPTEVTEAYNDPKRRYTLKHRYLHLVVPRADAGFGTDRVNPLTMKWASVYIYWGARKHIVHEGGYHEFPFLVTRFLKSGDSPYGYGPGMNVKAEIAACLKLERIMDVLGEVAAFPRVLMLAEQVGEVDLRAGGITVVRSKNAGLNLPREWATAGRYDVGKDRLADKEEKIRQAFYVPMLQVISSVERQMTATEVTARQAEKVLAFSPSMSLFISDCNVLIRRIFCVLMRLGRYPVENMPGSLILPDPAGSGRVELEMPALSFHGKIAQAIEAAQRNGVEGYMQQALAFTQVTGNPAMLEILDIPRYARFLYESSGAPVECLRSVHEGQAEPAIETLQP